MQVGYERLKLIRWSMYNHPPKAIGVVSDLYRYRLVAVAVQPITHVILNIMKSAPFDRAETNIS